MMGYDDDISAIVRNTQSELKRAIYLNLDLTKTLHNITCTKCHNIEKYSSTWLLRLKSQTSIAVVFQKT